MNAFQEDFLQTIVNVDWGPQFRYWGWGITANAGSPPGPGQQTVDGPVSEAAANALFGTTYAFSTPIGNLLSSTNIGDRSLLQTIKQRKSLVDAYMFFGLLTGTYLTESEGGNLLYVSWDAFFSLGRYLKLYPKVTTAVVTYRQVGFPPIHTFSITQPVTKDKMIASGAFDLSI